MSTGSDLEAALLFHIRAEKLEPPELQWVFAPPRRYRFDFAWPGRRLAVEVDGGTRGRRCEQCGDIKAAGRHTRMAGIEADAEKYSLAAIDGWKIIRVTAAQVEDGRAVGWVKRALREVA